MAQSATQLDENQLDLLINPKRDREWIETFLNVRSDEVGAGLVAFNLTEQQRRIVESMRRLRKLLIIKGRQTRCSTILMAKAVHRSTCTWGQNFVIITQTDQMTQNFRTIIKDWFGDLAQAGIDLEFDIDNSEKLRLKNRKSTFHFASAEQKVGLRGINTAHWVHASEIAHWQGDAPKRIMGGLIPASPPGGVFVCESTPNGAGGWFYDKVMDSMPLVPRSTWTTTFYPWWLEKKYSLDNFALVQEMTDAGINVDALRLDFRPTAEEETLMNREQLNINQVLWRRIKAADLMSTGQYFAQEYPEDLLSCWLAAGVCFFHDDLYDHLDYYRRHVEEPMVRKTELPYTDPITDVASEIQLLGPNLEIYEPPQAHRKYVQFADISAGISVDGDYSASVVLDAETFKLCAILRVRTLPGRVGRMVGAVGRLYNWAYTGIERNTYGLEALTALQELHYPNLYYDVINQPESPKLGWATSTGSREMMLGRLRSKVFNHSIDIRCKMAILEMGSFSWRKVEGRSGGITFKAEAERGNDDIVMALAGACTIAPYAPNRVKSGSVNVMVGSPNRAQGEGDNSDLLVGPGGVVLQRGGGGADLPWFQV